MIDHDQIILNWWIQMKIKSLLLIALFITPSLCFGKVTVKVRFWISDQFNMVGIEKFDSSTGKSQATSPFLHFEKRENKLFLKDTPRNKKEMERLDSFLGIDGVQDHLSKFSEQWSKRRTSGRVPLPEHLEEYFFLSGYTLNAYHGIDDEEKVAKGNLDGNLRTYWFSKD